MTSITDISTLAAADTATIDLKHPATGAPLGWQVVLWGPGSRAHQAATAARNQRLFDKLAGPGSKGGKPGKVDAEQQARDQAAYLAACTHSISGWAYKGGSSPAHIEAAYSDASIGWLAEQVAAALGDWATFLPQPETA